MRRLEYPKDDFEYAEIVKPGGSLRYISFSLLKLRRDGSWRMETGDREHVFVLISGQVDFRVNDLEGTMGYRRGPFWSKAYALYVSGKREVYFKAVHDSEIAVASAPSSKPHPSVLVKPGDVRVRIVGELNWRRHVHDVVYSNVEADHLLVGETFNPPGNWSSYPPHRHDVDDIPNESDMEEIYHFRVYPEWGFGAQFIYTDDSDVDEIIKVENGVTVIIDRGYHPVVAAPGYEIYYLWVLAGKERILVPRDDPKHSWIKAMEESVRNW